MLRNAAAGLSVLAIISAIPWMYLSMGHFGGFAWGLFGFELLVCLGGLMTISVAFKRVDVGGAFPLAMACYAGTLLVAAVFGIYVDAKNVIGSNHPSYVPWVNRTVFLYLGVISLLALIAMLDVYRRNSSSWELVIRSAIFLVPVIAVLGFFQQRGFPAITDASGELSAVRMIAVILGGLFVGILMSVGGHFLIRSFEVALPENLPPENA